MNWKKAIPLTPLQIQVAKEFADIEFLFAYHGGNTKELQEKALKLAHESPLSYKQAVEKILLEDDINRQQPTGFLQWDFKEENK